MLKAFVRTYDNKFKSIIRNSKLDVKISVGYFSLAFRSEFWMEID